MDTQYTMNYQHNIPAHLLGPDDKIELAVLSFSLDGISAIGRSLIDHAIEHPWLYGIAAGLIVGGTLFLPLPVITGFGRYGPIAGRLAARLQGWIGDVVKDSLFAILQRLEMTGVFGGPISEAYYGGGMAGGVGIVARMAAMWAMYFGV